MSTMTFEWTQEQGEALETIDDWLRRVDRPALTLGGYAGTGKSTLVAHQVREWEISDGKDVAVACLTGKAASVLRAKGLRQAQTLHALMYDLEGQDRDGKPVFQIKAEIDADVIVVDEASMVPRQVHDDLMSFGIPVLFVGDHGQLEPVGDDPGLMSDPDVRLEVVLRQALESPILAFAHHVRECGEPPFLWFRRQADVKVKCNPDGNMGPLPDGAYEVHRDHLRGRMLEYDALICGRNVTRHHWNRVGRSLKFDVPYDSLNPSEPRIGDVVLCRRNGRQFNVFNGQRFTIVDILEGMSDKKVVWLNVEGESDGVERIVPALRSQFGENTFVGGVNPAHCLFDYGYAMTCHASQGSSWGSVAVIEERGRDWDMKRWRYTAATRAERKLVWS